MASGTRSGSKKNAKTKKEPLLDFNSIRRGDIRTFNDNKENI